MRKPELRWFDGTAPESAALLELRRAALRRPLGLDFTPEQLARDLGLRHLRATLGGVLVGALMVDRAEGLIRQVAVDEKARGTGVGRLMMLEAEDEARRLGMKKVALHARDSAVPFYGRLGYEPFGPEYDGFGVPHQDMGKDLDLRDARDGDVPAMTALIFADGVNEWNHLPRGSVTAHLAAVATGATLGVVALDGRGAVSGFATFRRDGFVTEAVVRRDARGKGLGARLLKAAAVRLFARGVAEVTADRHEENAASAAMMRKAGFEVVKVYDDPTRRPTGSRRTALCRLLPR